MSTLAPERPAPVDDDLESLLDDAVPCEGAFEDQECGNPALWRMYRACGCPASFYCDDCRKTIVEGILPYYEIGCVDCGKVTEPRFERL